MQLAYCTVLYNGKRLLYTIHSHNTFILTSVYITIRLFLVMYSPTFHLSYLTRFFPSTFACTIGLNTIKHANNMTNNNPHYLITGGTMGVEQIAEFIPSGGSKSTSASSVCITLSSPWFVSSHPLSSSGSTFWHSGSSLTTTSTWLDRECSKSSLLTADTQSSVS